MYECISAAYDYVTVSLTFISTHASLIVAICAMLITYFQFRTMKAHNMLSVAPQLSTTVHYAIPYESVFVININLINRGLGPAIINEYKIWDGNSYLMPDSPNEMGQIFVRDFPELDRPNAIFHVFRKSGILGAGETAIVASLPFHLNPTVSKTQIIDRFSKYHLVINYESAYGVKGTYDSRCHLPVPTP